ncbi:Protein aubergine [Orchesella cincta]|uniref:Protein aubergine n=1 Tax=Orchesella cincta TaxID=48709 RepID=A0A1D2NJM8_ORCCI|nr:Protein aubergine [Orchesella cincta]
MLFANRTDQPKRWKIQDAQCQWDVAVDELVHAPQPEPSMREGGLQLDPEVQTENPAHTTSSGSTTGVERGLETLAVRTSSSSSSSQTAGSVVGSIPPLAADDSAEGASQRGAARGLRTDVDPTRREGQEGKKGTVISMKSNYYEVRTAPGWALYEYRVDVLPEVDRTTLKKTLFKRGIAGADMQFGYVFDGTVLYTPKVLGTAEAAFTMVVEDTVAKIPRQVVVKLVTALDSGSPAYVAIYNLLLRKCMFQLGLLEMGRNFFDPVAAIDIPAHRLTLARYVTSIRHHEDKMLLCVETTHKVLRMDSVLLVIKGLERSFGANQNAFREAVKKELNGTIVMTTYNRKTYHIDDIEFDKSPQSMFERKGEQQTLVDYYRVRHSLTIKDLKQPLLKAKASKRDLHAGKAADPGDILLVPELCQSTGLTDNMRANFSLMKELSKYLHQAPQEKGPVSMDLTSACGSTQSREFKIYIYIKSELVNWGMELDGKLVELKGRILAKEVVSFAKGTHQVDDKGDFTMAFRSQQMLTSVNLTTWVIIVPQRDFAGVDNLVRTMTKVAAPLSMAIGNPKQIIKVPDARSGSYLSAMEDALNLKPQMIFVILPNNKAELYNVVKKRLAVDKGGAMVATFSANFTKYFSTTSLFKNNDELCETMLADLIKCCHNFQEVNGELPERIIMYRDGVGEGQLKRSILSYVKYYAY